MARPQYALDGRSVTERNRAIAIVSRNFDVDPEVVVSSRRDQRTAWARQVAYWMLWRSGYASAVNGRLFNRDHSTILHGIQLVQRRRDTDAEIRRRTESCYSELRLARGADPDGLVVVRPEELQALIDAASELSQLVADMTSERNAG